MNVWTLSRWMSRMLPSRRLPRGPGIAFPRRAPTASVTVIVRSSCGSGSSKGQSGDVVRLERRDRVLLAGVGEDGGRRVDPREDHPEGGGALLRPVAGEIEPRDGRAVRQALGAD